MWIQKEITLQARPRGFHLVTDEILRALPELRDLQLPEPVRYQMKDLFEHTVDTVAFAPPDPIKFTQALKPLQVALVNSRTQSRPEHADALAQYNLDGGGNIAADKRASTPLPTLSDDKQLVLEQSSKSVKQLEQEVQRLLTQLKSTHDAPISSSSAP